MVEKVKCFLCGEGFLEEKSHMMERENNGYKEKVKMKVLYCDVCECETVDQELSLYNIHEMKKFYDKSQKYNC